MLEFGDIVTLENNKEYVVASTCEYNNLSYVYFVNTENPADCILGSVVNDDINIVEDLDTFNRVMPLLLDNVNPRVLEDGENNE